MRESWCIGLAVCAFSGAACADTLADINDGRWIVENGSDPFTDEFKIIAAILGKDTDGRPSLRDGFLVASCRSDGGRKIYEMKVSAGHYVGDKKFHGIHNVKYRVDKKPAKSMSWKGYENSRFTSTIDEYLVSELSDGSAAIFEVTNYRGQGRLVEFSLNGAGDALTTVVEACSQ